MATAKKPGERGPAPDLMLAIGVPKGKPASSPGETPEEDAGVPEAFSEAAGEAFPELSGDPARMAAFYDAIRAAR